MKLIAEERCRAWLSERLGQSFDWTAVESAYPCSVTYMIPSDSGRKTALARALSTVIDCGGEGLLWITEWGVFPSSENMALFLGYRRSLGDDRSVHAAPGHLFVGHDLQMVECLLDLVLYFFWDANVFDSRSLWLRVTHDESVTVYARDIEVSRRDPLRLRAEGAITFRLLKM
jgi:hypothetical protein